MSVVIQDVDLNGEWVCRGERVVLYFPQGAALHLSMVCMDSSIQEEANDRKGSNSLLWYFESDCYYMGFIITVTAKKRVKYWVGM